MTVIATTYKIKGDLKFQNVFHLTGDQMTLISPISRNLSEAVKYTGNIRQSTVVVHVGRCSPY